MKRLFLPFLLLILGVPAIAFAVDASSTSFTVRQVIQSISGGNATWSVSTSTSFNLLGAGGQTAVGTSTSGSSFSLGSGILQNLHESIIPVYTQVHYHWRNDNGSETTATGVTASEDLAHSALIKNTTTRLRVEISNEGGTQEQYAAQQFRLEYAEKSGTCAASSGWADVGAVGGDFDMSNSANLTEGANTTNIANGTGGVTDESHTFLSANGGVRDTTSQTGALTLSSELFVELEYSIEALAAATDGATYCFRVTDAGSATLYDYSIYPEATIASALTLVVSTNQFGTISPTVVSFATSTIDVASSNPTGWSTSVTSDDRTTVNASMDLDTDSTTDMPDQTEWIPGVATTTPGTAVRIASLANSGSVLALRVMTASGTPSFRAGSWWGTTDSYVDAATTLWAGFASSSAASAKIGDSSIADSNALNTVLYYLKPPLTQKNGSYTAPLTYTATANP